uniref:NADH:ubiquinone oxidoreductase intermediate-associated protein 30 domain-containing protein n=1 Tax=Eucampia antarctica TaxID=49252 RepID=A0A7S2RXS1_9STRA|mmetsp:Transcript_27751/g.26557  ORF Transcript_27751/g.26557 Transcript_27751/m.26557 type:complete len:223 (+) Transcript_27751:147-815(+)
MWNKCVSILLMAMYATATVVSASSPDVKVTIADFTDDGKDDRRTMETINDPVMGGSSHSSQEQKKDFLYWHGEVKNVWFLKSPGFCIVQTAGEQSFPQNLGDFAGISYVVNISHDMLLPLTAQLNNGAWSSEGYPITYHAILQNVSSYDGKVELFAPWSSFTGMFHGKEVTAPALNTVGLSKVDRLGLSTFYSHKAGEFSVELFEIFAKDTTQSPRGLRAKA